MDVSASYTFAARPDQGFVMGQATVELVEADGATLVKVTGQGHESASVS